MHSRPPDRGGGRIRLRTQFSRKRVNSSTKLPETMKVDYVRLWH